MWKCSEICPYVEPHALFGKALVQYRAVAPRIRFCSRCKILNFERGSCRLDRHQDMLFDFKATRCTQQVIRVRYGCNLSHRKGQRQRTRGVLHRLFYPRCYSVGVEDIHSKATYQALRFKRLDPLLIMGETPSHSGLSLLSSPACPRSSF